MRLIELARELEQRLPGEERVVHVPEGRNVIFVGDIHGDLDAFDRVLAMASGSVVVFLGDLVDRGPFSRDVLTRALAEKLEHPLSIHLLMGNHEAWGEVRFRPADFWDSLPFDEAAPLASVLLRLPYVAWHPSGVLALHGALPDVPSLAAIDEILVGGPAWRDITWGDWRDGDTTGTATESGRPQHDERSFSARARQLGVRVLVRSHQPNVPTYLFGDRCLTLFTSNAYGGERRVALLPAGRGIESARDLDLVRL